MSLENAELMKLMRDVGQLVGELKQLEPTLMSLRRELTEVQQSNASATGEHSARIHELSKKLDARVQEVNLRFERLSHRVDSKAFADSVVNPDRVTRIEEQLKPVVIHFDRKRVIAYELVRGSILLIIGYFIASKVS